METVHIANKWTKIILTFFINRHKNIDLNIFYRSIAIDQKKSISSIFQMILTKQKKFLNLEVICIPPYILYGNKRREMEEYGIKILYQFFHYQYF